jgi:hypothetical protein
LGRRLDLASGADELFSATETTIPTTSTSRNFGQKLVEKMMSPMSVKFRRKADAPFSDILSFEHFSSGSNLVCLVVRNWTSPSRIELAQSPKIRNLEFSDK